METLEQFEWVDARANCSIGAMFMRLYERIDTDVKALREVKHLRRPLYQITCDKSERKIFVSVVWDLGGIVEHQGVSFELDGNVIRVKEVEPRTSDKLKFSVKASLFPDGKCRFQMTDTDATLELWQVSKMALEPMFFGV